MVPRGCWRVATAGQVLIGGSTDALVPPLSVILVPLGVRRWVTPGRDENSSAPAGSARSSSLEMTVRFQRMTFCIGIRVKAGIVVLSDTRVVKGAEVSRKSKLSMFALDGSEAALMTSGLRSVRDKVVSRLAKVIA